MLVAAAIYLVRVTAPHWPAIRERDLSWSVAPLALSALLVGGTFAILLAAWTASLHWCAARIRYLDAARIWFTANLARFIPGTVWQFASLAVLASRYRVSPLAATATVLLEQLALLITGLLLLVGLTPAVRFSSWWQAALLIAVVLIGAGLALPRPGGRLGAWLERRLPGIRQIWSGLTPARLAGFLLLLAVPWLTYGIAFRLLAIGLLGSAATTWGWGFYIAAFTASYLAGVIAVFAPAGLLVREAALIGLLAPQLGHSDAVILAGASRIWLTALELLSAFVVLSLPTQSSPERIR